jgi:murein DD-endopeptidase MepM/ murein hydrolase activator NlpD
VRLRDSSAETSPTLFFAGLPYPMLWDDGIWWTVVGAAADFAPGEYWVQISSNGEGLPNLVLTVVDAGFLEEYIELAPETGQLLTDAVAIEAERQLLDSVYAGLTPERLWSGPFILPAAGALGDTFGLRRSFDGGPLSNHSGLDIAAGEGEPVMAANAGRVAYAGELHLRGNTVIIDHGAGVFSGYHHLSQILVAEGQDVAQGEVIGAVGATGLATAPHLHWEMIVRGVRVDPLPWTQAEINP